MYTGNGFPFTGSIHTKFFFLTCLLLIALLKYSYLSVLQLLTTQELLRCFLQLKFSEQKQLSFLGFLFPRVSFITVTPRLFLLSKARNL